MKIASEKRMHEEGYWTALVLIPWLCHKGDSKVSPWISIHRKTLPKLAWFYSYPEGTQRLHISASRILGVFVWRRTMNKMLDYTRSHLHCAKINVNACPLIHDHSIHWAMLLSRTLFFVKWAYLWILKIWDDKDTKCNQAYFFPIHFCYTETLTNRF